MNFVLKRILNPVIYSISTFVFLSGCNSVETIDSKITLSFTSTSDLDKAATDTLQLDTVKILLRDVQVKNQSTNGDANVKVGPIVIKLNLTGITTDFAVGNIPPGNYDRIKFKIHKVDPFEAPPDPEFREGSNESLRYSVIVKGTFNNDSFDYKSRTPAHQDLKLEAPLIVGENGVANLTIVVDPYSWFMNGTNVMDPGDSSNVNNIDNNIKESFKKAFQDNNYDGVKDP
jgi:hypothetical protein